MDDIQVGSTIRAVRLRLGLSQAQVAERAGVAQSTVSNLERGRIETMDLAMARRVCRVLDVRLPLAPRWRGADLYRLLDARHAALVNSFIERLDGLGWQCEPEHTFNWFGERGSVDVLGLRSAEAALLVPEIKSVIVDVQDTISTLNRKARAVPKAVAEERGWKARSVGVVLVVADTSTARRAVSRHAALFDAAFPARTVEVRQWLEHPAGALRGILFVPDIAPGDGLRKPGRRYGQ